MDGQPWAKTWRADPAGAAIADRHYNRQSIGAAQFVPPGRCVVLRTPDAPCLWTTSWPFAEYVQHAWPGAWVNSLFRNEAPDRYLSSDLITAAVAATLAEWPDPPDIGIVSMVDPDKVRSSNPGYCYLMAGWSLVGRTRGGLLVYQLLPADFPEPSPALGHQPQLVPA